MTISQAIAVLVVGAAASDAGGAAAPRGVPAQAGPAPMPCFPAQAATGPGVVDPFRVATPAAAQLNADGKVLYRQGRWDEARARYRAAETADPEFLAPALNVACSYVRQERFAEAVAEARRLLDRSYLPWSQEILDAADMGALKVRPEGKALRDALDQGRLHWADGVAGDLIFVARTRAPLKLGGGPAVAGAALVLGPRQEVFAWSPRTLRYRQLTSREGRVLAVARSSDGRRLAFATAEKVIRGDDGRAVALRGVVVEELELATLSSVGQGTIDGDVRRLDIVASGPAGFAYRVERAGAPFTARLMDGHLDVTAIARRAPALVTLTAMGVAPRTMAARAGITCAAQARDIVSPDGVRRIELRPAASRAPAVTLGGPFGAGLAGLPLELVPPDKPKN